MVYHFESNLSIRQIQSQVQPFSQWFPVLISDQSDGSIFWPIRIVIKLTVFLLVQFNFDFCQGAKTSLDISIPVWLKLVFIMEFCKRFFDWLTNQIVENQTDRYKAIWRWKHLAFKICPFEFSLRFKFLGCYRGGTTLDCIIWSLVDTHKSATSGFGFDHIRV